MKRQVSHVGELLDFGGDRGQYIPRRPGGPGFVHEISGVPSVPGVELLATEKELEGRSFDLVLLCHVLEHASEPRRLVERIAKLLRDRDSLLYVEVPFERPSLRLLGRGKISSGWLGAIRRVRPALLAADLLDRAPSQARRRAAARRGEAARARELLRRALAPRGARVGGARGRLRRARALRQREDALSSAPWLGGLCRLDRRRRLDHRHDAARERARDVVGEREHRDPQRDVLLPRRACRAR